MKKILCFVLTGILFTGLHSAVACDDKSCETAYISAVEQYVHNHQARANSARDERVAYAKVRENRDRSLNEHVRRKALGRNKY